MILRWMARRKPALVPASAVTDGLMVAVAQAMAWEYGLDEPNDRVWREAREWTVRNRRRRDELGLPQWPY